MSTEDKYVWCRPMGGLNDNLCQIAYCVAYCESYHRTLVLNDIWGRLFDWSLGLKLVEPQNIRIIKKTPDLFEKFKTLSCFPKELEFSNFDYKANTCLITRKICIQDTATPLCFDLSKKYDETLLVHQQCGGGVESRKALQYFQVNENIAEQVQSLRKLYGDYTAVHIRNTDYISDYVELLQQVNSEDDAEKILICSDDHDVKKAAQEILKDKYVSVVDMPLLAAKGVGLHHNSKNTPEFIVKSALLELCMLAYGKKLVKCPIKGYYNESSIGNTVKHSGFSNLAAYLHSNKTELQRFARQNDE